MKKALTISLLINLGLFSYLVFWSIRKEHAPARTEQFTAQNRISSTAIPAQASAPIIVRQVEPSSFQWNQLESTDYRTYIKNLRGIGCPEDTLRSIVSADVDVVYQEQNRKLERQLTDLAKSSWSERLASENIEQAVKDELLKLPGEEIAEIDGLLGIKPFPIQVATGASSPPLNADESDEIQPETPVALPLALRNIDTTALGLSDEQIQQLNNLREQFVTNIGGTNQDPNDPTYLARWQQNIPVADNMFRLTLGNQSYAKYLVKQNQSPDQTAPQ